LDGHFPQEGNVIEFVPGRRYRVQSEVGEIIGTFVKKEGGKLKFADVVRLVEASHEGEELLATAGIYDAELWLQSMVRRHVQYGANQAGNYRCSPPQGRRRQAGC